MIRKNYSEDKFRSAARIANSRKLPRDFFAPAKVKACETGNNDSMWSRPHGSAFRENSNSL